MDLRASSKRAPLLAAIAAAAAGCDPHLPIPAAESPAVEVDGGTAGSLTGGGGGVSSGGGVLSVTVEPPADIGAAPSVLRVRAEFPGTRLDPKQFVLVEGTLTVRQVEEFYRGKVSETVTKKIVDTLTWSEGDAEVLAPTAPLLAGEAYTLVMADITASTGVQVAASDSVPLLSRVWPPDGASGSAGFAVWCAPTPVPRVDVAAAPDPAGPAGRIQRGAVVEGAGERCLRFEANRPDTRGRTVAVPPPLVTSADALHHAMRLDPRPLQFDAKPLPSTPLPCNPGEVRFGPGCATVADDRIYARSTGAPLLWAIAGAGTDTVLATAPGDPFVIAGLPPSSEILLDVAALDTAGAVRRTPFTATTLPPQPHVVLNEVLAHPLGPKPAQEWVEIVNDGPATAMLDGYVLMVATGATPLPPATLAPGAFALVVTSGYMAAGGPDVAPPPGTLLLTVPRFGKEGLSNEGDALVLLDGDGKTVSTFPASPKPKQGFSVARTTPSAPDALPASFALATPSPGRPNTW